MQGSKEMFLIMREQDYNTLESDVRALFTHAEVRESNEYETHKGDPNYLKLNKEKRKATKAVQEYLFNKRHK